MVLNDPFLATSFFTFNVPSDVKKLCREWLELKSDCACLSRCSCSVDLVDTSFLMVGAAHSQLQTQYHYVAWSILLLQLYQLTIQFVIILRRVVAMWSLYFNSMRVDVNGCVPLSDIPLLLSCPSHIF